MPSFLQFAVILFYLHVLVMGQEIGDNPYCKIRWNHVMCTYKNDRVSRTCGKRIGSLFRFGEHSRPSMLRAHNKLRDRVASGEFARDGILKRSAGMMELKWDWELETMAQRWAFQCMPYYDPCRDTFRWKVNQNVYKACFESPSLFSSAGLSKFERIESVVKQWGEDQLNKITREQWFGRKSLLNPEVNQVMQMIWNDTRYVGCGRVTLQRSNTTWETYVVCNYAPAGNVLRTRPYQAGEPCSKCLCLPPYKHLCVHSPDQTIITAERIPLKSPLHVEKNLAEGLHFDKQIIATISLTIAKWLIGP